MIGVLGQSAAAVAEAGVVVVAADARLQAHAVDDVGGVEAEGLAVGVELVEVDHAEDKVGVGPSINRQLLNIELVNFKSCVIVHFVRKMFKLIANIDPRGTTYTNLARNGGLSHRLQLPVACR